MLSGSETDATSFGVAAPARAAPKAPATSAATAVAASMRVRIILLLTSRTFGPLSFESSPGPSTEVAVLLLVLVVVEEVVLGSARLRPLDEVDADLLDAVAVDLE